MDDSLPIIRLHAIISVSCYDLNNADFLTVNYIINRHTATVSTVSLQHDDVI